MNAPNTGDAERAAVVHRSCRCPLCMNAFQRWLHDEMDAIERRDHVTKDTDNGRD